MDLPAKGRSMPGRRKDSSPAQRLDKAAVHRLELRRTLLRYRCRVRWPHTAAESLPQTLKGRSSDSTPALRAKASLPRLFQTLPLLVRVVRPLPPKQGPLAAAAREAGWRAVLTFPRNANGVLKLAAVRLGPH